MGSTEPQRIRPFQFYIFAPKTRGWRIRRLMCLAAFVVLVGYIVAGIVPDRSFEISKLRGLTPQQVITKFGKPRMKWWGAGNLFFLYDDSWRWAAFRYSVIFKDGHVVKVRVGGL